MTRSEFHGKVLSPTTRAFETLMIAGIFVLMARLWPINQHVVFFGVWAALVVYLVWRGPQPIHHTAVNYVPLGLMGLLFAIMAGSSLWAPELWRTFSYAAFSFLHFLIGASVALLFPLARIVRGLILGVAGIALHSVLLAMIDPSRGITYGLVMGQFTNQSELSHVLGLGAVLIFSAVSTSGRGIVLLSTVAFALGFYLLYLDYLTSLVAALAALWAYLWVFVVRRFGSNRRLVSAGFAAAVTVALVGLLWVFREPVQVGLGKTPDFSGRIPFWEHFWSVAMANPWGGLGWGWLTWLPPGEETPHPVQEFFPAHQGYIEIAYMLGIPAMLILIAVLSLLFLRSFWFSTDSQAHPWLASALPALIAYLAVFDLAATFHTRTIGMFFLGLVAVAASGLVSTRSIEEDVRRPLTPPRMWPESWKGTRKF